jgi:predicted acylesterase/phospholipase RssA
MSDMGLVLQGGGALGAYEYGAVTRLVELGWRPRAVAGVSIGAINAAAIAGAKPGEIVDNLHRLWKAITLQQLPWLLPDQQASLSMFGNPNFYRLRTDLYKMLQWTNLCDTSPMLATLADVCDFDLINDPGHMRLAVTATNLKSGRQKIFSNFLWDHHSRKAVAKISRESHESESTRLGPEHIMASGSLPPGFPATMIDGEPYWDGGLFDNTPLAALLDLLNEDEFDTLPIFVINLFPSEGRALPSNLAQVQERMMELKYQNRFWAQYGGSSGLQGFVELLRQLQSELPKDSPARKNPVFASLQRQRAVNNVRVIEITPAGMVGGGADFSRYGVTARYEAGREAIDAHFAKAPRGVLPKRAEAVAVD